MDVSANIHRRLDRLTADPASICGQYYPEVDALRHDHVDGFVLSLLRSVTIATIAVGPTIFTIFARHA